MPFLFPAKEMIQRNIIDFICLANGIERLIIHDMAPDNIFLLHYACRGSIIANSNMQLYFIQKLIQHIASKQYGYCLFNFFV